LEAKKILPTLYYGPRAGPGQKICCSLAERAGPGSFMLAPGGPGCKSAGPCHLYYPGCRLDIRQDSEFATGFGYPKTAFKRETDTDKDIRNAFVNISRIQTFGKSCTLHNHSFIIFRSVFSAFCAMTPSLSMV